MSIYPKWKEERIYAAFILLLVASAIVYLGVKTYYTIRQANEVGQPTPYEHTIVVEGEGKVIGKPDIATITMGTESKGIDAAAAQQANNTIMNKIIYETKAMGISEEDIQTSDYSIYEDEEWNPDTNEYESNGWIVSNYITVKVRDTSKLSTVLTVAGQNGITNISGPTFTIDDTTNLKAEARAKAIADSREKAQEIAETLGLRIEKIIGYTEWMPNSDYYYGYGLGGSSESVKSAMPDIESGSSEITLSASVTYLLVE
jgi:uncharacterized protein YggE